MVRTFLNNLISLVHSASMQVLSLIITLYTTYTTYIEKIIVMLQVCGTHQYGVHANDFRTILHKLDSTLSKHL